MIYHAVKDKGDPSWPWWDLIYPSGRAAAEPTLRAIKEIMGAGRVHRGAHPDIALRPLVVQMVTYDAGTAMPDYSVYWFTAAVSAR